MSKLDDALKFFGLRKYELHNHEKVKEVMRKKVMDAHPDKSHSSGENIQKILEARNIIQTHMKYYKPISEERSNGYMEEKFVPSEDARNSLVEMIQEAKMQNIFSVGNTINAILASGHLEEAVNTPDEENNTPLHVAAQNAGITKSSKALFYDLMTSVEDAFDYSAINNEKKTLLDVIDDIGRSKFRFENTFFEKIEKRTKEAMIDKALKLIEETVKDNKTLPKGFMAMKNKFQDPDFQKLSGAEKLVILQDIIRERDTHYEGFLGTLYSFFSNRKLETSTIYQAILDFNPLKTETMINLESAITSSNVAWKGLQIAYKEELLHLKESPEYTEEKTDSGKFSY